MRLRSISSGLQMRVRRYVENKYEEENYGIQRGENLINSLSNILKKEILNDAYIKYINQIPVFKKNFSEDFIKELSLIFKEFKIAPEEYIYKVQFNYYIL